MAHVAALWGASLSHQRVEGLAGAADVALRSSPWGSKWPNVYRILGFKVIEYYSCTWHSRVRLLETRIGTEKLQEDVLGP